MKNRPTIDRALREARGDLKMALNALQEIEGRFAREGEPGVFQITGLIQEVGSAIKSTRDAYNRIMCLLGESEVIT